MSKQIASVSKSAFFCIRQLRLVRSVLDHSTAVLLCNSLVSSKLDFCNSLYIHLPKSLINRLQLVQNSLARVIFPSVKKFDHISSSLKRLHWLPVEQRILFKTAVITFKSLQLGSPSYLSGLLTPVHSHRNLRSNNKFLLSVPRINSAIGQRVFSYAAPSLWNSLPLEIRSCTSLSLFRSKLKTHFFLP